MGPVADYSAIADDTGELKGGTGDLPLLVDTVDRPFVLSKLHAIQCVVVEMSGPEITPPER